MSCSGSRSYSDWDVDEELALRIALERSKVDMGAVSDLPPRIFPTSAARMPELAPSTHMQLREGCTVRATPTLSPAPACALPIGPDAHAGIRGMRRLP